LPKNADDHIRRRRERIALLLAKGATPRDISEALEISMAVVHRDIRWFNKENDYKMFEMAKQTIPTLYQNCLSAINELIKQCWQFYIRSNERPRMERGEPVRNAVGDIVMELVPSIDRINQRTRLEALRLAGELTDAKFRMIQDGPAVFELQKLERKVNQLRSGIEIPI
jgi:hypothetical protein